MSEDTRRIGALEAGGTKMVMAVCTPSGEVIEREEIPTEGPVETMARVGEWFAARDIDALGVGAFGPTGVNPAAPTFGHILETPKTAWKHFDMLGALKEHVDVPVGYDTDVNVACLGEQVYGCAQGRDSVVYITIGTGIGAGVMIGGKLVHGMLHPEAGHVLLAKRDNDPGESACPYHDRCFEGLAAGPAIEKRWGAKGYELAERDEVWDLESDYIAEALVGYVMTYSPQKIILGGGVMKQAQLFPLVREKFAKMINGYIVAPELEDLDSYISEAGCGGDQGILGCVALALQAQ
ncbi:ROK family protein [Olsenella sp. YH-ols2217]|uniref:fructokinase n=1 Tax=Kribbibacterium absianum TaxID=3044210 RepID=A0ABT6ZLI3_9ACTN|nr:MULTISPECIES: ROK family protein [unclassified Olsenella]MDJ1121898.1 ROK family protein [Olsenella sp. YH-ols2216]MDJ1129906.1 ROK family protein [Olsenella sp. YH-ols2217]